MEVNNYKRFIENVDDYDDNDDYDYIDYGKHDYTKYDLDEDENEDINGNMDDDMEHLKSLLLKMFHNKGIENVKIANNKLDLSIRCLLNQRERLSEIVGLFDLINKLRTDILPQYDSEFDMWQNYNGETFEFGFYYNDGNGDDNDNDYGEDNDDDF